MDGRTGRAGGTPGIKTPGHTLITPGTENGGQSDHPLEVGNAEYFVLPEILRKEVLNLKTTQWITVHSHSVVLYRMSENEVLEVLDYLNEAEKNEGN